MKRMFETLLERAMFSSRWALAPVYVALCLTQLLHTKLLHYLFMKSHT